MNPEFISNLDDIIQTSPKIINQRIISCPICLIYLPDIIYIIQEYGLSELDLHIIKEHTDKINIDPEFHKIIMKNIENNTI